MHSTPEIAPRKRAVHVCAELGSFKQRLGRFVCLKGKEVMDRDRASCSDQTALTREIECLGVARAMLAAHSALLWFLIRLVSWKIARSSWFYCSLGERTPSHEIALTDNPWLAQLPTRRHYGASLFFECGCWSSRWV